MATNSVENVLAGAKDTLAKAEKFTKSVEGSPTSSFAPKPIQKPKIPQSHEYSQAPYALARELSAKRANVEQYAKAEPK